MKVFPVVHINTTETAVEQATLAFDSGADGVYLIDHHNKSGERVLDTLGQLRVERPNSYIGVNLLGITALDAVRMLQLAADEGRSEVPSGLWVDDIRASHGNTVERPKTLKDASAQLQATRILGGVAFKYTQTFTENPELAVQEVESLLHAVDVVTTSGRGTGAAPTVAKIRAMKAASGDTPLAVASGVSLENIAEYEGVIDEILVASSIETRPYSGIFNQAALEALVDRAHRLK